jgi:hypothetical protein
VFSVGKKSAAQGERDGFCCLGCCYRNGEGCEQDAERAKENHLVAAELGLVYSTVCFGELFDENDPQRFVWLGKAAARGQFVSFLVEMFDQIGDFRSGTGYANVVFAIGRALKGHINNEKRTIFGEASRFDAYIRPANQALHFYEFQLQSYRKAVDSWTIVGLRNKVVKDIRKMIGKMIWDAREEAEHKLNCNTICQCPFCVVIVEQL